MDPKLYDMAGFFPRQRRCGFSRNTLNTSEVWSLATTRSLSRVLCCRLLNCCGRKSTRSCLSRTYFDRTELQDDDLRETLAKHAACWTGDSIDPSIAAAEVCRRVTMGSEATAVDRADAVQSRLQQYCDKGMKTFSMMRVVHSNEVPQPSSAKHLWQACTRPSLSSMSRVSST